MGEKFRTRRANTLEDRRARAAERAEATLAEMPLQELRQARKLSQEELAAALGQRQSGISKIERRTDMHVSTLRRYIEGMGGTLDIIARFPEGDVRIRHFEDADPASAEQAARERWVATWRRAGPALDAQKRRELEQLDTPHALAQLASAFAVALERARPADTSGLAEQQRWFRRLAG